MGGGDDVVSSDEQWWKGEEVEVTGAASECNDPIIRSTAIWSTRINGRAGRVLGLR